ncbi:MAG: CCA tRNA nucleotidyltransferase [SAR202 cluster bacterium]|nr:CCA tRNA nucleotidyltransferase [SAR202 cluster bacterium]|tara:strand:- start:17184 stop:18698 length:1515 start_codon:yes stop_codon:yes gene_type:complete
MYIPASEIPSVVQIVSKYANSSDIKCFLVGGAVRDILMNRTISDIDIVVNVNPFDFAAKLSQTFGYGTPVVLDKSRSNICRLAGIENILDDTNFPKKIDLDIKEMDGSIRNDLSNRDFSIDAIALDLINSCDDDFKVIDFSDGISDLLNKKIRMLDENVFLNDPLRLIRAIRLSSDLNFNIDEATEDQIIKDSELLKRVSSERVRDEFMKILLNIESKKYLRKLDDLCLLEKIFEDFIKLKNLSQPEEHYWDVFEHSIQSVGYVDELLYGSDIKIGKHFNGIEGIINEIRSFRLSDEPDDQNKFVLLKLTALLHDIGKYPTRSIDVNGRIRFLGHSEVGAKIADVILTDLRMPKKSINFVKKLIDNHLRPGQLSSKKDIPSNRALYRFYRDLGDLYIPIIILYLADVLAAAGPKLTQNDWNNTLRYVNHIIAYQSIILEENSLNTLLTGHEIMSTFGLESGKIVGDLLEKVNESHALGQLKSKQDALDLIEGLLSLGEDFAKEY